MPTIWLTCLWDDNKDGDVDFVAQELIRAGVTVKLHRWNPRAKRSLWDQIKEFISDPEMADAWAVFATRTGLGSELCQRQFAGAFRHVVSVRGDAFPVIALFPSPVVPDLIPGDISMRLNVTLTDPDWKERLGLAASMEVQEVMPYALHVHEGVGPVGYRYAIEVRPRAGTWAPFIAAIPIAERTKVIPDLRLGPEGQVPDVSVVNWSSRGPSTDGAWWLMVARNPASPTQSYFVTCQELPSELHFGAESGEPTYRERFESGGRS